MRSSQRLATVVVLALLASLSIPAASADPQGWTDDANDVEWRTSDGQVYENQDWEWADISAYSLGYQDGLVGVSLDIGTYFEGSLEQIGAWFNTGGSSPRWGLTLFDREDKAVFSDWADGTPKPTNCDVHVFRDEDRDSVTLLAPEACFGTPSQLYVQTFARDEVDGDLFTDYGPQTTYAGPVAREAPQTSPSPAPQPRLVDDSCPEGEVPEDGFADAEGNAHESAIDCVVWWQVANGTSTTTYSPSVAVNRAQMASFISRLVVESGGSLPTPTRDHFTDDNGSPHETNINRLAEAGIVGGTGGGLYNPNGQVRRDQMATFLVRAYEYRTDQALPVTADYFQDDDGNAHEPNINKAAEAGFTGGTASGGYQPAASVTRAQMASFLARVLDLLVEAGFATVPARQP